MDGGGFTSFSGVVEGSSLIVGGSRLGVEGGGVTSVTCGVAGRGTEAGSVPCSSVG